MKALSHKYIPVLPVKQTVLFPSVAIPIRVGRPKSMAAVKRANEESQLIFTVTKRPEFDAEENTSPEQLYRVGTLSQIEQIRGNDQDGYHLLVRGLARFKLKDIQELDGMLVASGEELLDEQDAEPETVVALTQSLKKNMKETLDLMPGDLSSVVELIDSMTELSALTHLAAAHLPLDLRRRQELLEKVSIRNRTLALLETLEHLIADLKVRNEVQGKMNQKFGKQQRETILREQMKQIQEELGEVGEEKSKDYRTKIDEAKMPDDVKKVALEELKRLEALGSQSPETHIIRNYLDLLCALPWSKSSHDHEIDLDHARKVLDDEHFGLDKVKKRIIQHLAVMKLKKSGKGSILLLVGPPGVGKTSIAASIAHALKRKFVRVSVGGVRDDSEIRGHRRTYIGSMPGRVIQGIKRAGENDPVFVLDEIDKLARGYQGDPAGALLEVLDPEQNSAFLDHYLDVGFDLSKVFFVATANSLDSIPLPLLDRMEVIDLSGYTVQEKMHIAKNHLISKQRKELGMRDDQIDFEEDALKKLVSHYTRESGVRELQRKIATLLRFSTEKVLALKEGEKVMVTLADLEEALGFERYQHEQAMQVNPEGVVTGLAWTPVGGEILFIETTKMKGSGKTIITGQLGDVMKESAQIALSLVRSQLSAQIPHEEFEKSDLHIHVPQGAIPKDGPSAGVTLFTAIASLYTNRKVDAKLAMTGEITLRGAVTPVGGVKEKLIAAHRAGMKRALLSKRNEKDLIDVPEEVKKEMQFHFVETVSEVLKVALGIEQPQELEGGGVKIDSPLPTSSPVSLSTSSQVI